MQILKTVGPGVWKTTGKDVRNHQFSTYAKSSGNMTILTP